MKNFVRLYAIETEIKGSQEFGEKRDSSASYLTMCNQIASLLFLMIYILHILFVQFHPLETEISVSQKNSEIV